MSDPAWAPQHQPQTAASGRDSTNVGRDQNNHFHLRTDRQYLGFSEVVETVERETEKVRRKADREKEELEHRYRGLLQQAYEDYNKLRSDREVLIQGYKQLKVAEEALRRDLAQATSAKALVRSMWWQLLVVAVALLLVGTCVGFVLAASRAAAPASAPAAEATAIAGSMTAIPPSDVDTPSAQAEAVAREYLELGDENDGQGMLSLVTEQFLDTSGGREDFLNFWTDTIEDVDGFVSLGRPPFADPTDPSVFWVQVVWRHKTANNDDIRTMQYDLDWWAFVHESDGYKIDARDGRTTRCPATDTFQCARSDTFNGR